MRACRSAGVRAHGASAPTGGAEPRDGATPDWQSVEVLLARLAETRAVFPTATSHSSWISGYEPGRRLRLEADGRSSWIQVEHLRGCWETFERLGRIRRTDVLEPGRCSAFVMALFARVPGVGEDRGDDECLVLRDPTRIPSNG